MNSSLIREFEDSLGTASVLYRPEDLLLYEYDGSVEKGRPGLFPFASLIRIPAISFAARKFAKLRASFCARFPISILWNCLTRKSAAAPRDSTTSRKPRLRWNFLPRKAPRSIHSRPNRCHRQSRVPAATARWRRHRRHQPGSPPRHRTPRPQHASLKTATPFPQRWGLLRKGRAVFRREDRLS